MDCKRALLADYVFETKDGKLSAIGLFEIIFAPAFPATHPSMGLALQFQHHAGEDPDHRIKVRLVNEDGQPVVPDVEADLKVGAPDADNVHTLILNLQGLQFAKAGSYRFDVIVDGRFCENVPFCVQEVEKAITPEA